MIKYETFAIENSAEQSRGRPRSENIYDVAPPLLEDRPEPGVDNLYEIVDGHDQGSYVKVKTNFV